MNQTCINEAKNLKLSDPELSTDRDVLMYGAYGPTSASRSPAWGWCSSNHAHHLLPLQPRRKEAVVVDLDSLMSGNVDVTNYVEV